MLLGRERPEHAHLRPDHRGDADVLHRCLCQFTKGSIGRHRHSFRLESGRPQKFAQKLGCTSSRFLDRVGHRLGRFGPRRRDRLALWRRVIHRFFLRASSNPAITQIGRLGDSQQFRSAKRYPVTLHQAVLALRVDENIFFANASQIEDRIVGRALRRQDITDVLLACGSVNRIDSTGHAMLLRMSGTLADIGIRFNLSEVKGPLLKELQATGLADDISGNIYFSNDEALRALTEPHGDSGEQH